MLRFSFYLLIFMLILPVARESFAQEVRFGLKGGATFYHTVVEVDGVEYMSDPSLSWGAGLHLEWVLNRFFSIQPEILFLQKASEETTEGEVVQTLLRYADLPILVRVNIPIFKRFGPYLIGGPYAGYLLKAESIFNDTSYDTKDLYEALNYGIKIGGGWQAGPLLVEMRYDVSVANLLKSEQFSDDKPYLRGAVLLIGISF